MHSQPAAAWAVAGEDKCGAGVGGTAGAPLAGARGTIERSIRWRPERETTRAQEKGGGAAPFCGRRRVSTGPRPSPVTCYGKRKRS